MNNEKISDAEKEVIYQWCESVQSDDIKSCDLLWELSGILKGIICDNELNDKEIYSLKSWLDKNSVSVCDDSFIQELHSKIDAILDDGVITSSERSELLSYIDKYIENYRFDILVRTLIEKVKKRENIGLDLISVLDNGESIDRIHRLAVYEINTILNTSSKSIFSSSRKELIYISLVVVALTYYHGGNFWDGAKEEWARIDNRILNKWNDVTVIAREVISYVFELKNKKGNDLYISWPLRDSIVPNLYLGAFFEFVYAIYETNFNSWLPDNLHDEFKYLFTSINSRGTSLDGDTIRIDVNSLRKTYKLIKSTRSLISGDNANIDALIGLSTLVIRLIDSTVQGNSEVKINNAYLQTGYEEWLKTYSRSGSRRARLRWVPGFELSEDFGSVYLVPPVHNIYDSDGSVDYTMIRAKVYNGEELLCEVDSDNIRKSDIIGGYRVTFDRILIDKPLGQLRYVLCEGDRIIYDSEDKLYRNIIVFSDGSCDEISNYTEYSGAPIICCDLSNQDDEDVMVLHEYYCLVQKLVESGTYIDIGEETFSFGKKIQQINGTLLPNHFVCDMATRRSYQVYSTLSDIVFDCNCDVDELFLDINGKNQKLVDVSYSVDKQNGINRFFVNLRGLQDGIYRIKVIDKDDNVVADQYFALDRKVEIEVKETSTSTYSVTIDSQIFNTRVEVQNITCDTFNQDCCVFVYHDRKFSYRVSFKFKFVRIDNGPWRNASDKVNLSFITSDSQIDVLGATRSNGIKLFEIVNGGMKPLKSLTMSKESDMFITIPIGSLLSYSNELKLRVKDCMDVLFYRGVSLLNEPQLKYDKINKELMIDVCADGENNIICEVFDKDVQVSKVVIQNNRTFKVRDILPNRGYSIRLLKDTVNSFIKGASLLWRKEVVFKDFESLIGKMYPIQTIVYQDESKNDIEKEINGKFIISFDRKIVDDGREVVDGQIYFNSNGARPCLLKSLGQLLIEDMDEENSRIDNKTFKIQVWQQNFEFLYYDYFNERILKEDFSGKKNNSIEYFEIDVTRGKHE